MKEDLRERALEYHRHPVPGKIKITPTKPLTNSTDLSLAYSPGVAAASELIHQDPEEARHLTARSNLVAVISNGTAVLGLGDIGALAAKPVMEGKGVLFKAFADVDVFDIEIDEHDPDRLIEIIASLAPTFGGINLEDIKAPECFYVERALTERLDIPVFHDDQHGTAIITAAALINALHLLDKKLEEVRLVASGAGAAGIACLDLLLKLGLQQENVLVCDRAGVIHAGREKDMNDEKLRYAVDTDRRTLAEALVGADVFLGVSAANLVNGEMVDTMADRPVILALANPDPEILPEEVLAVRPDALVATGRSDYPNQVNNVLCFPYMFRGALDVGARTVNDEMQMACVHALAKLARREVSAVAAAAYGGEELKFGPRYLIPKPFDPRLLEELPLAVARAAMESGNATRPIEDLEAYRERLQQYRWRSGLMMKPVYDAARQDPRRVVFAEGEEEVILRATQVMLDDGVAKPVLIGRPAVIEQRVERYGLRFRPGEDCELINPESDPRYRDYWTTYHSLLERQGVSPTLAKSRVRSHNAIIAALAVVRGDADGMIAGIVGRFDDIAGRVLPVIGLAPGCEVAATLGALHSEQGTFFICDTHVNVDPSAEQLAEIAEMAIEKLSLFGIEPRVALVSHSAFGTHDDASARKMRATLALLRERLPEVQMEGEMPADMALDAEYRARVFPNSRLEGPANLLVMPDIEAARIAFNFGRVIGRSVTVGPMLLGAARPAHILSPSATVRRVVNMTALTVVEAQRLRAAEESTS